MSDSTIFIMRRMEDIRSRIEEIRNLGEGQKLSASVAENSTVKTGNSAASYLEADEFAILLQEAAGLIESSSNNSENGLSQSLLGSLLGGGEDGTLAGMGLTGLDSINALLNKTGAGGSVSNLDEGLLGKAIDAYKKQSE